ncbi:hypothetical protein BH23BAC2_BH23BAC2_00450 [soil metagenome]
MTRKKFINIGLVVLVVGVMIAGGIIYYMFNMPHRDVQATVTDYQITARDIVEEYLSDPEKANEKYLDDEGESKIIEVTGKVASISEDFNKQKVVLLKSPEDKSGVSCTFTLETNDQVNNISIGETISLKGVIRAGASYDERFADVRGRYSGKMCPNN